MTEEVWESDEDVEYTRAEELTEEEQMFQVMLDIVTGEVFTEELTRFADMHAKKFISAENSDECTHEQFDIFQAYRRLIEAVIDREMTQVLGRPFSCASIASKFNESRTGLDFPVFEEVADVLNSLNDFLAFKGEMIAHMVSKDKQDLVVETFKINPQKTSRSQRIRNWN